jgi:chemotaxis protein MotB
MSRRSRRGGHGGGGGHGNSERWLLTYADMITLLMAFFIMMYSMSVLNLEKFREVAFSIRSGFGGVLQGGGKHLFTTPPGKRSIRQTMKTMNLEVETKAVEQAKKQVKDLAITAGLEGKLEVGQEARGLVITVATDDLLFRRGSADMTGDAVDLLAQVTGMLSAVQSDIGVEGHTCDLPIHSGQFPSNWELSSARASRVVRFLMQHGFAGERLSAVGYADTRPREANDTEAHRSRNRRVEIVIMDPSAMKPEDSGPESDADPDGAATPLANESGPQSRVKPVLPKIWGPVPKKGKH